MDSVYINNNSFISRSTISSQRNNKVLQILCYSLFYWTNSNKIVGQVNLSYINVYTSNLFYIFINTGETHLFCPVCWWWGCSRYYILYLLTSSRYKIQNETHSIWKSSHVSISFITDYKMMINRHIGGTVSLQSPVLFISLEWFYDFKSTWPLLSKHSFSFYGSSRSGN